MIFRKNLRKADKEILHDKEYIEGSDDRAIISIKAEEDEQIFSTYNYDSNEKLNAELDEFIWDKARFVPMAKDIKIKLYTNTKTDEQEVVDAIKNNYKKEYIETKSELKRNAIFSLIMLLLGLAFMSFLLLMHVYFYNVYLEIIVEITTWVFIWESVDSFFLQRAALKRKRITLLKLYTAEMEIIKLKNFPEEK